MAMLAALAPALSTISTIATVAGTAISAMGTIAAGKQAEAAAEYEAKQQEVAGREELAAAGHERDQLARKKELALSTLQTNAAASGFSATDPTALNLAEDIERYGTVQEQMAMHGGLSRKEGRFNQAAASRATGQAARQGAAYKAIGTVLSGVSTLADRYNPSRQTAAQSASPYHYGSPGGWRTSVTYS